MPKSKNGSLVPQGVIEAKIYFLRGQKVMLDRDLAGLYGVPTHRLNEQVKRNLKRFPVDFMFRLNYKEFSGLISQFAISKSRGGIRKMPCAFTENGVAMLSSVLNSERAVQVNIQIMRTFTKVRQVLSSHEDILGQLAKHSVRLASHDKQIIRIFEVIQALLDLPVTLKRKTGRIGFIPTEKVKG